MTAPGLIIDGDSLSLDVLRRFESARATVGLSEQARRRMERSIEVVREAVRTDRVSYGITTGFGAFANKRISADQVRQVESGAPLAPGGVGLELTRSPHRSCGACCC